MTIKNHTKTKQCACDMYKVIYLLSSRQKSHTAGVRMKMKNNRIITQIISRIFNNHTSNLFHPSLTHSLLPELHHSDVILVMSVLN